MATSTIDQKYQVPILGSIKIGCQSVAAYCDGCGIDVRAWILGGTAICPKCSAEVYADSTATKTPAVLPFFYLPKAYRAVLGDRPTTLSIVPAYQRLDRVLQQGFARFAAGRKVPVCVGDGTKAVLRETGSPSRIDCTSDCSFRISGQCKAGGLFLFHIPEIDIASAFQIRTSPVSTENIFAALKRISSPEGLIRRQVCTLSLVPKVSRQGHRYTVLELAAQRLTKPDAGMPRGLITAHQEVICA